MKTHTQTLTTLLVAFLLVFSIAVYATHTTPDAAANHPTQWQSYPDAQGNINPPEGEKYGAIEVFNTSGQLNFIVQKNGQIWVKKGVAFTDQTAPSSILKGSFPPGTTLDTLWPQANGKPAYWAWSANDGKAMLGAYSGGYGIVVDGNRPMDANGLAMRDANGVLVGSKMFVGIGTSTPQVQLDVKAVNKDVLSLTSATDVARLGFHDSGTTNSFPNVASNGNDLLLAAGGSERVRVYADGKVLVGSAPAGGQRFVHIQNPLVGSSTQIGLSAVGSENHAVIAYQPATDPVHPSGLIISQRYAGDIALATANGQDRLLIKGDTGNVGIGTSTPGQKLTVVGGASGSHTAGFVGSTGAGLFLGYAGSDSGSIQATKANGALGDLALQAFNGNVGIGTSTPAAKLDVVGSVRFSNVADRTPGQTAYFLCVLNGDVYKSATPCNQ